MLLTHLSEVVRLCDVSILGNQFCATFTGLTAEGKINRKDFGMNWSKTLGNGWLVVGDEVLIKLDIECLKAK
ncbi:MAG: YceI family protein [Nitrospirae bacterium]|nr:YceI family protein [Nitrospirota bacterium]